VDANLKTTLAAFATFAIVGTSLYFVFDDKLHPNRAESLGTAGAVSLKRDMSGHYRAEAYINGIKTYVLVDTGATDVSISRQLAERLGIASGMAVRAQTANGAAVGYAIRLDSVSLGGIVERDVAAIVVENLGTDALLGMSFLSRMDVRLYQGIMTIRSADKPSS
jgi:aspartyl protease family protein